MRQTMATLLQTPPEAMATSMRKETIPQQVPLTAMDHVNDVPGDMGD
jgi:hypothetical protein